MGKCLCYLLVLWQMTQSLTAFTMFIILQFSVSQDWEVAELGAWNSWFRMRLTRAGGFLSGWCIYVIIGRGFWSLMAVGRWFLPMWISPQHLCGHDVASPGQVILGRTRRRLQSLLWHNLKSAHCCFCHIVLCILFFRNKSDKCSPGLRRESSFNSFKRKYQGVCGTVFNHHGRVHILNLCFLPHKLLLLFFNFSANISQH